jgi:tetratricopeptide (TPR) repeat protein
LFLIPATAQEELPIVDYLRAVNEAFQLTDDYSFDDAILQLLVEKELFLRYGSQPDISDVPYDVLQAVTPNILSMHQLIDTYSWWRGVILVWLKDAPPPQEIENESDYELYAEVLLYDFEADGIPELLLHGVQFVDAYVGARWDGTQWVEFDVPLTVYVPSRFSWYMSTFGILIELGFDDSNGDGLPEWRLESAGSGCQGCSMEVGHFFVLGWQDGSLKQLVEPIKYVTGSNGVTWDFDQSGFVKRQTYHDSWGCYWNSEHRYRWETEAAQYFFTDSSLEYDASFECALRVAEKANWAGELEAAGVLYQLALSRVQDLTAIDLELYQYARIRLAIIYTLTGQHDLAKSLVGELIQETPQSQFIEDMLNAIRENAPDAYRTCAAVHNLFTRDYAGFSSLPNGNIPTEMTIGYVLDDVFPNSFYRPIPTPDKAGCDVEILIAAAIDDGFILNKTTPGHILESRGIDVREERLADIDDDGTEEWIVWLTADVPALIIGTTDQQVAVLESRITLSIPASSEPLALPTPTPAANNEYTSDTVYPCQEGASCDMRDAKTVYTLIDEIAGLNYRTFGEPASAEARLRRALETAIQQESAGEYPLRYLWGLLLEEEGDSAARAAFEAIIEAAPDSPWAVLAALHTRRDESVLAGVENQTRRANSED